jgi:hypothetical protein
MLWIVYPRKVWHYYILQLIVAADFYSLALLALVFYYTIDFIDGAYSWYVTMHVLQLPTVSPRLSSESGGRTARRSVR